MSHLIRREVLSTPRLHSQIGRPSRRELSFAQPPSQLSPPRHSNLAAAESGLAAALAAAQRVLGYGKGGLEKRARRQEREGSQGRQGSEHSEGGQGKEGGVEREGRRGREGKKVQDGKEVVEDCEGWEAQVEACRALEESLAALSALSSEKTADGYGCQLEVSKSVTLSPLCVPTHCCREVSCAPLTLFHCSYPLHFTLRTRRCPAPPSLACSLPA